MRASRHVFAYLLVHVLAIVAALGLFATTGSGATAATASSSRAPSAADYEITIRHDVETDTVFGTARNVGGSWVITLEWRKTKTEKWTPLAQSDVQKGKGKAYVGNVVRGDDFDFTGQWRACVKKGKTKTCGEKLLVS